MGKLDGEAPPKGRGTAGADRAAARAALAICESLMISLVENRILTGEEARGLLEDACHAVERGGDAVGAEAVRHVQRIIEGTFNVNADGNGDPAPLMDGQ